MILFLIHLVAILKKIIYGDSCIILQKLTINKFCFLPLWGEFLSESFLGCFWGLDHLCDLLCLWSFLWLWFSPRLRRSLIWWPIWVSRNSFRLLQWGNSVSELIYLLLVLLLYDLIELEITKQIHKNTHFFYLLFIISYDLVSLIYLLNNLMIYSYR